MSDIENSPSPVPNNEGVKVEDGQDETASQPPGTAASKDRSPVPPTSSKPGSARSQKSAKPGSAKSAKSSASVHSSKSGKTKSPKVSQSPTPSNRSARSTKSTKSNKGKPPETAPSETPASSQPMEMELPNSLPEGAVAIFLASKTQEIFNVRMDEDIKANAPYKLIPKADILQDIFNRAAVSDFQPFKKIVEDYPEDEMLIGYDADFKHGQNFIICTKLEAKEELLRKPEKAGGGGEDGEGGEDGGGGGKDGEEEEDTTVYTYIPPLPKEWVSQGSEIEIDEESLLENRKRLQMSMSRVRREFGAPIVFNDRNVADSKDAYIECTSYVDKVFDLKKIELDNATQAVPDVNESASQTDWRYPRNANTQTIPREFTQEQRENHIQSKQLESFLDAVFPRFELAMQQNEIVDIFFDDWMNLGDDDGMFGVKSDTHLKEYQSFTDLQFSKDKTITSIDWHPTIRGVIAVGVAEQLSMYDRIDNAARVIMTPSLILIWSFTDPIHPQLLLEAPDDIYCFKFNPMDPNIIIGGCINGQVVLWDISQHADRLKTQRGGNKPKKMHTLPGFEDDSAMDTPIVRYCAVSSIENSHRAPVTDLLWVPDHMEINRMGVPIENRTAQCSQIMSCAVDHSVLLWDTRPPKTQQQLQLKDKKEINNPMGIPTTFKHLDLTWKPLLKITLPKSEPGGDHSPTKFSLAEKQGDRSALSKLDPDKEFTVNAPPGGFGFGKPGSAGTKKTLQNVKTHFYIGTEDGEVVYADWMPQKDQDSGKIQTPKADYYHTIHDGPINCLQRSPFFRDIVLVVGGWTFTIWKEGVSSGPILQSNASNKKLTAGHWSNSRPAVFYISKQDGSLDVWDLLDRTHEPSMSQNVSPAAITSIFPWKVTHKQHLLAVGDSLGTLHILEIPWSLRHSSQNELTGTNNYFEREVSRRAFVQQRWDFREKEKIRIENEAKSKAGIAPKVQLTEEEIEHRQKQEFISFQEEENTFLRNLGLKEEKEEELPNIE